MLALNSRVSRSGARRSLKTRCTVTAYDWPPRHGLPVRLRALRTWLSCLHAGRFFQPSQRCERLSTAQARSRIATQRIHHSFILCPLPLPLAVFCIPYPAAILPRCPVVLTGQHPLPPSYPILPLLPLQHVTHGLFGSFVASGAFKIQPWALEVIEQIEALQDSVQAELDKVTSAETLAIERLSQPRDLARARRRLRDCAERDAP